MSKASIIAQLQTLINESNLTTGKSDQDLTTAVERLIRGWGGSTVQITEKDVTLSASNEYLSFECEHEPDIVAIAATQERTNIPGAVSLVVYKGEALGYVRYSDNGTRACASTSQIDSESYPYGKADGNGTAACTYSEGTFSARARGYNGWNNPNTYHCIAITF